jgi:hypothetical protein
MSGWLEEIQLARCWLTVGRGNRRVGSEIESDDWVGRLVVLASGGGVGESGLGTVVVVSVLGASSSSVAW